MTGRVVVEIPGLDEVPVGTFADVEAAKEIAEQRVIALGLASYATCDLEWREADGRWELYDRTRFTGLRVYAEGTGS